MVTWLFRNRSTGRITVAQRPNLSLIVFALCFSARWLFSPVGMTAAVITIIGVAALLWWSFDEILRGANPFRRILGAGVLAVTLLALVRSLR